MLLRGFWLSADDYKRDKGLTEISFRKKRQQGLLKGEAYQKHTYM